MNLRNHFIKKLRPTKSNNEETIGVSFEQILNLIIEIEILVFERNESPAGWLAKFGCSRFTENDGAYKTSVYTVKTPLFLKGQVRSKT